MSNYESSTHADDYDKDVEWDCRPLPLLQRFAYTFMRDVNLGVLLIDTQFRLVEISGVACQLLSWERDAVLGRRMNELFGDAPSEYHLVQRSLLDGAVVRDHILSWTNEQYRYDLLMDCNVLRNEEDQIEGAYVLFKDVSNLRSLEERVRRNDRYSMVGQIAAGAAHEIRNPLTSIKGFIQMFKKTFAERGMEKEVEYSDIALSEISRINALVSEFLLLSKPKLVRVERLQVRHIWEELLPAVRGDAVLHQVKVVYEADESSCPVVADRDLLKQVLCHMTRNAMEAMVEGGTLTVAIRADEANKRMLIIIRDTGAGVPGFLMDKIFDPFFTTKENGTGLGLAVCQRIIHDIGGSIRVASKGYGTTFTISIPY